MIDQSNGSGTRQKLERERAACVRLAMAPGVGTLTFHALVKKFGSPLKIFERPAASLGRFARLVAGATEVNLDGLIRPEMICWTDEDYPKRLAEITGAPPVLWYRGRRPRRVQNRVAIVGTRKATAYGRRVAADMARELSRCGVEVVSGLALGVDGAAHRGALEGEGGTVAVLGSGIDHIFPSLHRDLASRVTDNGTVLTEFQPSSPAVAGHFPRRNRIISGLCDATVVVEARQKGGALITARLALDQERPIFAVPGDVGRPSSVGTNELLLDGAARPLMTVDQLLRDVWPGLTFRAGRQFSPANLQHGHEALLDCLTEEPRNLEGLCDELGQDVSDLLVELLELEMNGLVRQYAGKQFGLVG
jgi:DNA processing protein